MPHVRSPLTLNDDRSGLLVVDLQPKLLAVIDSSEMVLRQSARLLEAAELLGVPVAATAQYPQRLGGLDPALQPRLPEPEAKREFSAACCRGALDAWAEQSRDQIVIAGIETHVCVQQTVLDLIAEGQRVYVVSDAVASRSDFDHLVALERMRDSGATVTTTESILFEWCRTSTRDEFKAISALIKG